MMQTAVKWLFIVGTASLIFFRKITEEGALTWESLSYRSDFVFLAAVLIGVLGGAISLLRRRRVLYGRVDILVILAVASYVTFASLATVVSMVFRDLTFDLRGLGNLFKTLLGALIFVTVHNLLRDDGVFYRRLAMALYLSPLIPSVIGLAYALNPSALSGVFGPGGSLALFKAGDVRFQGLASNPFQVSISNFVAVAFVWMITLRNFARKRRLLATIGLVYVGVLSAFIFWSMTRMGVLLLFFGLTFGALMSVVYSRRALVLVPVALTGGVLAVLVAWLLIPPAVSGEALARFALSDERFQIWRYYLAVAAANPLGIGFNYEQRFLFDTTFQAGVNVHNGYLVAWVYAGFLGWASIMIFLWVMFRSILTKLRDGKEEDSAVYYFGAVTGFVGFWILAAFLGLPLEDFAHAILLAMVLAGIPQVPEPMSRGSVSRRLTGSRGTTLPELRQPPS